uniref:Uncharacterized protein n=1 Tax=Arundo donax TaxID=35708 RepID=A0A0A9B7I9_ARUDO
MRSKGEKPPRRRPERTPRRR